MLFTVFEVPAIIAALLAPVIWFPLPPPIKVLKPELAIVWFSPNATPLADELLVIEAPTDITGDLSVVENVLLELPTLNQTVLAKAPALKLILPPLTTNEFEVSFAGSIVKLPVITAEPENGKGGVALSAYEAVSANEALVANPEVPA